MKINSVILNANRKSGFNGIECVCEKLHKLNSFFKIELDDIPFYFTVISINVSDQLAINYILKEIGYYNTISKKDIDLRLLIGKNLIQVDDEIKIKQLINESSFC